MSHTLQSLLTPLRQSPLLAEIIEQLQQQFQAERALRQKFYEEMSEEDKVEFINGEVILHSPARNAHLDVTLNITRLLDFHVLQHQLGSLKVEKCLCVFPRNDYEPDIVFFSKEKAALFQSNTMKFPIPDLVVEVLSHSTEKRDRGVKRTDYEAHGVREYWIVDAEAQIVEQHLFRGEAYEVTMKTGGETLCSEVISGFEAPVKAFFEAETSLQVLRDMMQTV